MQTTKTPGVFHFIFLMLALFLVWPAHAIDQARTTTVDGRFYKTGTSDPLLDTALTVRLQILNPSKNCLIYEEEYTNVNTQVSDGYFKFSMGSVIGAAKRTANDPGFSMAKIYNNYLNSFAASANCPSGYVPLSGDERFLRIVVVPSATGLPENLAPEIALTSVPSASVAESVQGLKRDDMLVRNTLAPAALDQGALEAIFNTTTLPVLNSILDGTTSLYVRRGANGAQTLPSFAGNPASPGVGQIWYDTIDNEVKYWDGGPAPVVVGSGGGGGGPVSGNDITSGTITGTTAWNTSGNIATTGTITSSTSITVPQVSTREIFVSNLQPRTIKLQAPVSIVNPAGYTLTLPQDVPGTSGMALVGSNTGALSWQTIGLGTVTEVTAGTGLNVGAGPGGIITDTGTLNVNVGTTTGQIVQVAAGNKLPVIDGSNLTALSASNIAAGILPVNFGGTNNNSFLGNKIVGTNPTGTQLTNFTCTPGELITFDLSGNAGCSTIPTILGYTPANAATYVQKAGDTMTGTLNLASNGLVVGTNQLIVSGTNVGIGKTNPAEKLDVVGNIEATGTVKGSQLCIGSDCKNAWPVGGGGGSGTVTQVTAGTGLNVGAGPGGNFTTSGTLNIDVGTTNGKIVQVGPGNLLPAINASNLTSLNMNNAGSGTLAVARGGTGAGSFTPNKIVATNVAGDGLIDWSCPVGQMIKFDIGGMVGCDTIANILGYTPANAANYVLKAGDTMTGALTLPGNGLIVGTDQLVAGSGGVGIGTASPASQLHVSAVAPKFLIEDTQSGGKRWSIEEGSVAPATALQFRNATDNVTSMTLNDNGYVGIGAGAASNRLVVGSDTNGASSNPGSTISIGNATSNSILTVGQSSTARGGMTWSYNATPASAYMHVGAVGTNSLALQLNGGNVGVGISSPTAALQLKAGTAGIGGAPLKFTAGTNTTAAEDGAMEFDGTDFWLTANGARKAIATSAGGGGSLSGISSISNASGSITMTPQSGGSVIINQTTISSTPSSGALVVNGGVGVGGALNVQDSVSAASFTSSGGITAQTTTAATAGANQSSPNLALTANFWNGTASTVDRWTISNQMGTGTNPVSTLMFAHPAGTTGAKRIAFPAGSMVIGAQNPGAGKLTVDGGNILVRREDADSAVVLMTNSATANPNLILQRGQGDLTTGAYPNDGDTLGAISFRNSTDNTSNAAEIKAVAAGAHSASARGAGLQFTVTGSGGTTNNPAMTIQSDGKVGVGTTGPRSSLESAGGVRAVAGAPANDAANVGYAFGANGDTGLFLVNNTGAADGDLAFYSNASPKMTILNSNGYVGIGNTSPGYPLTVATGAGQFMSGIVVLPSTHATSRRAAMVVDDWGILQDSVGNGTKDFAIYQGSSATHRLYIGANGNVGIGTASPSGKLDVRGGTAAASTAGTDINIYAQNGGTGNVNGGGINLAPGALSGTGGNGIVVVQAQGGAGSTTVDLRSPASGGASALYLSDSGVLKWQVAKGTGNDFYIWDQAGGRTAMNVASNGHMQLMPSGGNVGVGTASPSQKLHVAGTVRIQDGTEASGKVLTSDASGNASWQTATPPDVTCGTLIGTYWNKVCVKGSTGKVCRWNSGAPTTWTCSTPTGWPGGTGWTCDSDYYTYINTACSNLNTGQVCVWSDGSPAAWSCYTPTGFSM